MVKLDVSVSSSPARQVRPPLPGELDCQDSQPTDAQNPRASDLTKVRTRPAPQSNFLGVPSLCAKSKATHAFRSNSAHFGH
jgi:hypothetical protein